MKNLFFHSSQLNVRLIPTVDPHGWPTIININYSNFLNGQVNFSFLRPLLTIPWYIPLNHQLFWPDASDTFIWFMCFKTWSFKSIYSSPIQIDPLSLVDAPSNSSAYLYIRLFYSHFMSCLFTVKYQIFRRYPPIFGVFTSRWMIHPTFPTKREPTQADIIARVLHRISGVSARQFQIVPK